MTESKNNLILTGMAGCGKSTAGVLLAKTRGMAFLDTDLLLQERQGRLLQDILDYQGTVGFLKKEAETIYSLACRNTVIATGGSAVLSPEAMEKLRVLGWIIYIDVPFGELEKRLSDIKTRGVVIPQGQSLNECYLSRKPLYEKYADITVEASGLTPEETVEKIIEMLKY